MDDTNDERNMDQLHVLDLPQLYTKPSADLLLQTLSLLTSSPPSWESSDTEDIANHPETTRRKRREGRAKPSRPQLNVPTEGVAHYLTSIVASDLHWISEENIRETVWEQASLRLSERSGRTGMPAMTRTFWIPTTESGLSLSIHEPALTSDNLGLKTWASSYQLAKRLHSLNLPPVSNRSKYNVLELGAGTGLVGLAAAAALGWCVCLTDLPEITLNLQRNAEANQEVISSYNGFTCVGTLDWTNPAQLDIQFIADPAQAPPAPGSTSRFQIILVADALYLSEHPKLIVQAIKTRLEKSRDARVIAEMPLRTLFTTELDDFKKRMTEMGLAMLEENTDIGYDDWGWSPEKEDLGEVTCWRSIWAWAST